MTNQAEVRFTLSIYKPPQCQIHPSLHLLILTNQSFINNIKGSFVLQYMFRHDFVPGSLLAGSSKDKRNSLNNHIL
jgi:hypothetical protein